MAERFGGRWERGRRIGGGGQADVYMTRDTRGRVTEPCVLKVFRRRKRVKREVGAALRLSHRNIVRVLDHNLEGRKPYLVVEYCQGKSLQEAERFWQHSPITALELFQQICEGLAYAHSKGVTHRDLKPGNIFLRTATGPAVIGDFGLCHLEDMEGDERVTRTDEAVGARKYTAPEVETGRVDDASIFYKSDVYSLGKVLYWLLSGKVFDRERHNELEWDLKGPKRRSGRDGTEEFWSNIYMEHVNRLLDLMIVEDYRKRIDVGQVLMLLPDVRRRIEMKFNPIGPGIQQPCCYCGQGHYIQRASDPKQASSFGLDFRSGGDWRILVCDACGHIQFFRVDLAGHQEWWPGESPSITRPEYTKYGEPVFVSPEKEESIPSGFLGWDQCTLMLWVQVPPKGQGLRDAPDNRYLLAHHTGQKDPMNSRNLFALRYTQKYRPDGDWEVLYTNSEATGLATENLQIRDTLRPGWHQFIIAWDHAKPELVLAIDGGNAGKVVSTTYRPFWPEEPADYVAVGSWMPPAPFPTSYCETNLAQVWIFDRFLMTTDPEAQEHLARSPA